MKRYFLITLILTFLVTVATHGQPVKEIKRILDTTSNPLGYVKFVLKKPIVIDTVTVFSTSGFVGIEDSIAYVGKTGRVYGPFKKGNYLLKVLAKIPNTFYHISHIVIDTSLYSKTFADSLASRIMNKINKGESSFEKMAKTYSADNVSASKGGDLGWFIRGIMLPQLDEALATHKKNELFKVWTSVGVHVVKIDDNPRKDDGFALLLKVKL